MSKTILSLGVLFLLVTFALGWQAAQWQIHQRMQTSPGIAAVPVIAYERFDPVSQSWVVALTNSGTLSVEVERVRLLRENKHQGTRMAIGIRQYGERPLVVDPDDTVLVSFPITEHEPITIRETGYWGMLDFRFPGRDDLYTVSHLFRYPAVRNESDDNPSTIDEQADYE